MANFINPGNHLPKLLYFKMTWAKASYKHFAEIYFK